MAFLKRIHPTPPTRGGLRGALLLGSLLVLHGLPGCGSAGSDGANDALSPVRHATDGAPSETGDDSGGRQHDASQASLSDGDDGLAAAKAAWRAGDLDVAFNLLSKHLIKTPEDPATLLLASQVELARGNRSTAIELAEAIDPKSPEAGEATKFLVQQSIEASRPEDAIDRLIKALDQNLTSPDQTVQWRHQLWALLNRTGRRQEASAHADVLCRSGHFNRALLISLLRRNESYPMALKDKAPQSVFYPGLGLARWHFSQGEFEQALDQLQNPVPATFPPAAKALVGRLLAETQATEPFVQWYSRCDDATMQFSDYWVALGIYFYDQHQFQASARALLEGIAIDPTDDDACHRLSRVLAALNRAEDAAVIREHAIRVAVLRAVAKQLAVQPTDPDLVETLPEKLLTLGRPFESIGWALLDVSRSNTAKQNALLQQREMLRNQPEVLRMPTEIALAEIDRNEFAMSEAIDALAAAASSSTIADRSALAGDKRSETPQAIPAAAPAPTLENVAAQVGIDFQWYHAAEIDLASIPLHQMMGGGIAVCDYDLDGDPDVYFGQGSGDPPSGRSTRSNQLYRNLDGHFTNVTTDSAVEDDRYSTGIAAGDVNQDGFPDLFLGALGDNRLLLNCGDGTFRDATAALGTCSPQFTSSVAIADLTGDAIPELYECVYVEMEGGFRLPERDPQGRELVPNPNDFFAEADRWYAGRGDGRFELRELDRSQIEPGTSLGLVITDIDSDGQNDVFVANDARPNHLLMHFGEPPVRDVAVLKGLAFGFRGYSNACMGIATGDFNRDGRFDLAITNYADEPNNHFLQGDSGVFSDFATRYQINQPSEPYVGFGIKAIDLHRNGWLDFFVTNGHVFDQRDRGKPFQMPPQVLLNQATKFVASDVTDSSGYWQGRYVGRSLAKIDFDGDHDVDFLVGHLDAPVALLANKTERIGNGIQLELVGTHSERDAIGTRVVVTAAGQTWTDWVTAGDGYFCSDEPVLDFGIGSAERIDAIEVHWISGHRQVYRDLAVNQRLLLVEGCDERYVRDGTVRVGH
ncbi:FG-GAP-like repeat-containing protein [Stieleria sp.]|uniref:FG-GAP-like repeat-containing protein n=1 Tax=Stieleria sp. TaxID=2795976 RepID=UPI00356B2A3D